MKQIEVEVRCFLEQDDYTRLCKFFDAEAVLEKEDQQETHYYSGKADLRIQQNTTGAKIVFKAGVVHETQREEIEVPVARGDFTKLERLFVASGHDVEIKWFRYRRQYKWRDIIVCLDDTRGYGKILELEKMATTTNQDMAKDELIKIAQELKIEITPKQFFDEKYQYYKENWRTIILDRKA